MPGDAVQWTVNKFFFIICWISSNNKGGQIASLWIFFMFPILFIASIIITFKLPLTALLISAIPISVESDCGKWMEIDKVMTKSLTLALSVGWKVSYIMLELSHKLSLYLIIVCSIKFMTGCKNGSKNVMVLFIRTLLTFCFSFFINFLAKLCG